jgi:hypothetical protein
VEAPLGSARSPALATMGSGAHWVR